MATNHRIFDKMPDETIGLDISFSTGEQHLRFDRGITAIRELIVETNQGVTDDSTLAEVKTAITALFNLILPFAVTWGHAALNTDIRKTMNLCEEVLDRPQTIFDGSMRGGIVNVVSRTLDEMVMNHPGVVIIMDI